MATGSYLTPNYSRSQNEPCLSGLVSECLSMSLYKATRELLLRELVILNQGQVTRLIPEMDPPLYHTTPIGGLSATTDLTCISLSIWRIFNGDVLRLFEALRPNEKVSPTCEPYK
ncbi:hypothetical protein TNCV_4551791 [Trichonephila clavipes]|nr:hypothetical protein TNCV_4551791 [Trichonephila clavipes]